MRISKFTSRLISDYSLNDCCYLNYEKTLSRVIFYASGSGMQVPISMFDAGSSVPALVANRREDIDRFLMPLVSNIRFNAHVLHITQKNILSILNYNFD